MPPVRPQLKPALRRVWRDATTLQLGLDPAHAVVIGGLDAGAARLVDCLDGSRDLGGLQQAAAGMGLGSAAVDELLHLLGRAGVLEDAAADHRVLRTLDRDERERLGPDIAAASIASGRADGGVGVLSRRRQRVVGVHGAGRVGASLVGLLAAAGVGTLVVEDTGTTSPADLSPGGLVADDVGARRQDASWRNARRFAPSLRSRLPVGRVPDLAVVADDPDAVGRLVDGLLRRGVPHLFARVRDTTGLVGPLVLPGRSSCQRCHDLHRSDRDPAWPSIAAQLAAASPHRTGPCDVVLAAAVAASAGLQVLAFLDGEAAPPTVDGTLEIAQSDGRVRRRSWSVHPSCGCSWPSGPSTRPAA
ncbi:MAG: ThiF family adenylyltransferase [Spirochaetaceae bacterium]|nr:ThiF family adenylyltransferase [Spirochaetaceae bacterium]